MWHLKISHTTLYQRHNTTHSSEPTNVEIPKKGKKHAVTHFSACKRQISQTQLLFSISVSGFLLFLFVFDLSQILVRIGKKGGKMSEVKDPKIKLFGRTIELLESADVEAESCEDVEEDCSNQDPPFSPNSMVEDGNINGGVEEEQESHESPSGIKPTDAIEEDQAQPLKSEELKESNATPMIDDDSKAIPADTDTDTEAVKISKSEEDQNDASNSQEKTLKKPDKIIPCPRCNSMETKFCYFNNYNVNQPRHFCRKCQRYWTAGGTMRNVPVGAGRRKNKNTPPQFRHLTTPEMLQSARVDLPNGVLNPNGTVLTFSSDTPLCESMASALNIADQTIRNGFSQPEEVGISVSHGSKENGDDGSSGSSVTAASSVDEAANCHPFPPQVPFFPGGPWAYPWISPPTFGPASFPPPYFSTGPTYWACAIPGTWNIPWVIPSASTAPTSHAPPCSGPNSPTLGKHSRDDKLDEGKEEEKQKERNSEKCLWVPKTLRIDDPEEAAKSSIWATLGIKHDRVDSIGGGGLFKAFRSQSKNDGKIHVQETSTVLQANPAALSRSLNFHESS